MKLFQTACGFLLFWANHCLHHVAADGALQYLTEPRFEWRRSLGKDSIPLAGNAIVLSPDELTLYVTASDGKFVAIQNSGGRVLAEYTVPRNSNNWKVTSHSGITVGDEYLVYAVVDEPPEGDFVSRKQSRVVAINHDTFEQRWISEPLDGEIAGTPVLSADGQFVYFTRNSFPPTTEAPTMTPTTAPTVSPTVAPTGMPVTSPPTTDPTLSPVASGTVGDNNTTDRLLQQRNLLNTGYFTILFDNVADKDVRLIMEEGSQEFATITNHQYGPVTIAHNVSTGLYEGGLNNTNDIVVWHSLSNIRSESRFGEKQLFQFPLDFDPAGFTAEGLRFLNLQSVQLGSASFSTTSAPAITNDGQELYIPATSIGDSSHRIESWVDGRFFDRTSQYQTKIAGRPSRNQPVFSQDGELLFVTTESGALDVIDLGTRQIKWKKDAVTSSGEETFPIGAKPVVSPDNEYVFYPVGSRLFAQEVSSGKDLWQVANKDGSYIVSEFCVSSDGRFLYYVGFEAENFVTAVQIAVPTGPTPEPTPIPTAAPTISKAPIPSPPTREPEVVETESDNGIALYAGIAGGVIGFLFLVGAAYFILKFRNKLSNNEIDRDWDPSTAPPSNHERQEGPKIARPTRYSYDPTRVPQI